MSITDYDRINEVVAGITACKTPEEALAFGRSLPREDRWMARCALPQDCSFLKKPDGTPKAFDGIHGKNTVCISYSDKAENTNEKDAEAVYTELFTIISSELAAAERNGQQLHVHVGEWHLDRSSLLLNVMALDIAERLGISHIGVENEDNSRIREIGERKVLRPGLEGWIEHAKSITDQDGRMAETNPDALSRDGRTQNRAAFVPHAFAKHGNKLIATDKYPKKNASVTELYDEREAHMLEKIATKADGQHVLHLCGSEHLYGLEKQTAESYPDSNIRFVGIRTEQAAYLSFAEEGSKDPERIERVATPFAYRPLVNGHVTSIDHARELAAHANRALGDKLTEAFFKDHPNLAPAKAQLDSIDLGGRTLDLTAMQQRAL